MRINERQGTSGSKLHRRRASDRVSDPYSVAATGNEPQRHGAAVAKRPDATFVAHLIATATQCPQTRTLRRAENSDADAIYRAAISSPPLSNGRTMRLSA